VRSPFFGNVGVLAQEKAFADKFPVFSCGRIVSAARQKADTMEIVVNRLDLP
jgi:hypothetical protein